MSYAMEVLEKTRQRRLVVLEKTLRRAATLATEIGVAERHATEFLRRGYECQAPRATEKRAILVGPGGVGVVR